MDVRRSFAATCAPATSARSSPTTARSTARVRASTPPSRPTWARAWRPPARGASRARARASGSSSSTVATPAAWRSPTRATGSARCAGSCSIQSSAADGLGRRLIAELVAEAEAAGYEGLQLETFSDLRAAPRTSTAPTGSRSRRSRPARAGAATRSPTSTTSSASSRAPSRAARRAPAPASGPSRSARRRRAAASRRGPSARPGRPLELAQAAREQAVGEPGDARGELGEVVRALGERPEDRARPAAADQLDRGVEIGADRRRRGRSVRGCAVGARVFARGLHPGPDPSERPRSLSRARADPGLDQAAHGPVSVGASLPRERLARRLGSGPRARWRRPAPVEAANTVVTHVARRVDHRAARVAAADVGAKRRHLRAGPGPRP